MTDEDPDLQDDLPVDGERLLIRPYIQDAADAPPRAGAGSSPADPPRSLCPSTDDPPRPRDTPLDEHAVPGRATPGHPPADPAATDRLRAGGGTRIGGPGIAGPESYGPASSDPESAGPESAGPERVGPESSGPENAGPEGSRPESAVPGGAEPRGAGPEDGGRAGTRRARLMLLAGAGVAAAVAAAVVTWGQDRTTTATFGVPPAVPPPLPSQEESPTGATPLSGARTAAVRPGPTVSVSAPPSSSPATSRPPRGPVPEAAPVPPPTPTTPGVVQPRPSRGTPSATLASPPASNRVGALTSAGGRCLDAEAGLAVLGTRLAVGGCNDSLSQRWTMAADGTLRAGGSCAEATGDESVRLAICGSADAAQWRAGPGKSLVNLGGGRCLADPGDGGRMVRLAPCDGGSGQRWTVP